MPLVNVSGSTPLVSTNTPYDPFAENDAYDYVEEAAATRPPSMNTWWTKLSDYFRSIIGAKTAQNGTNSLTGAKTSISKLEDVKNGEDMVGYLKSNLSPETLDYLVNYYLSEQSNVNKYNRDLEADSTKYQRTVADLKKAGLNPWLALSGLSAGSVSSASSSYGTSNFTGSSNTSKNNSATNNSAWIRAIALIGAILFRALL